MKNTIIYNRRTEVRKEPQNLKQKDIKLFKHEFTLHLAPVILTQFRNVHILRNLIFSPQTLKFYLSYTHIFSVSKKFLFKRLMMFLGRTQKLESGIWIIDELSSEYFHWFTDALTRLKAIEDAQHDIYPVKKKTHVILPLAYKQKRYVNSSLELLGYEAFYYNPKKSLKVELLTTCSHTAPMGNYNSDIMKDLRAAFTKNAIAPTNKKIYISRSKAVKRKITNEPELIQLLLEHNYEIHHFEDYSFDRQLEIMLDVKTLISLHGAGLTNMLFMQAKGNVVELRNDGDSHNNCYFSLSSSLDQKYYYLTSKGDREDTNSVNITVDLAELKIVLKLIH